MITMLLLGNIFFLRAQGTDEVKEMIDQERYASAENMLEKNMLPNGAEPETNLLLVTTYLEQNKVGEAGTFVKTFVEPAIQNNADPVNQVAYARYLLGTGKTAEANQVLNSILEEKKNQKNPALLIKLAEALIDEKAGDANFAIKVLEQAHKRDKNNPEINILKGMAYRKLGNTNEAYLSYEQALKKDPSNIMANYLMGKIFTTQKNPEVYMKYFMTAYNADSTFAPLLQDLYDHYYYRDTKEAKKYLVKYIANTDYSIKNDYSLTDILYLSGDYSKAIELAKAIQEKEGINSQPRLHKLVAYSYAKSGDTANALLAISKYFKNESESKLLASDYELRAQLTENTPGAEKEAIAYYLKAAEIDSLIVNKEKYAVQLAGLYKKTGDFSNQATWLGNLYQWKKNANNVDLFNWGIAHYSASEFELADSVFSHYSTRYPEDIYGYYWRAQSNAAQDSGMLQGMAIPYFKKVVEIGEQKPETHRNMLLKAYGYLGGYEANVTKDYLASLAWFEKYLKLDP
ncbi:MAG TPA: tetratricopeptide repeat protein, partial [Prolixibacteraceae bacterium]|nr:tetratricopeptide repeat protein [Prolixibacteraceae bacterium]